ncbi:26S proteasome regulatory subunit [Wickerhamomyces ciferrii]|uniref:26S proteasome regulatory subunit n=1 Tax=Wickerhamomyces ciferrii (strain ATCC 14091 / BCRC 22168 / CBS 111 / JCM 3599 / NBRC 0793 / NRRL Y-1031 F-60-10) TaxID=1206466 RepID=K0KJM2_WICCF|nr:26S proteasome regulatory subunit [Wickerhamomyces ciferrii]CCH42327.1 26S proteasome regulatory subunit [Wickerhamomyces ciferrii]
MSSFDNDIPGILATLRSEADPNLSPLFYTFEDLYQRKLWHQLTESLDIFYKNPLSNKIKLRLYNNFISNFKTNINQLKLVQFLLLSINNLENSNESLEYLTSLQKDLESQDNVDKEQALIFINIEIARLNLRLGKEIEAREFLDDITSKLDKFDSIDLKINQSFFSTNSEYFKIKSDYNNFYYQSLLYLSTLQINEDLTLVEQQKLAYELSISALLADKIYNFGELLTHPILKTLENGSYQWIIELLYALNSGSINSFSKILVNLEKVPILKNSESFLRQKICLMTLVELVFSKSIRTITFEEVSKVTYLQIDEVEHLVMRALSLGLLKGSIDQINQSISINWVQPRIINKEQIENMKQRLINWDENVVKLGKFMETNGKEIWIQ